ncbi:Uncharacterized protein SCF082_LOCUS41482 [Durusdinium trenchii]|uniref:Sulfotransferase n=1 Tax=Durusdinium trenchii TaxID=1381693 RepID=A0ABP0QHT7_9DINO
MTRHAFAFICVAAVVIAISAFLWLSQANHLFCASQGPALEQRVALEQGVAAPQTPQETKCLFPLVIHVGPHKTGTTSFQLFLHEHAEWLRREYGIFVAANETPKAGAYIPCTIKQQHGRKHNVKFANLTRMQELLESIGSMPENSPVILSSEEFSTLLEAEWNDFKSQSAVHFQRCLKIILVHRQGSDLRLSIWNEKNKETISPKWNQSNKPKHSPDPFVISLLSNSQEYDFQQEYLDILKSVFDSIDFVSYDYLNQANYSLATFAVCNATLHFTGSQWKSCKESIEVRRPPTKNPSELPTSFDVVRLAYGLYTKLKAFNRTCMQSEFGLRAYQNLDVVRMAEQMPIKCGVLSGAFKQSDLLWYSQTGAMQPTRTNREICFVDEASLELKHWALLSTLLPPGCQISAEGES